MKDIKHIRRQIDKVDRKISYLLEERRNLVTEVARYKKSKGLEIFDSQREMEVLKKANVYDGAVFRAILDSSKDFQAGIINAGTFGLISGREVKSLSPLIHSFWGDYEYKLCPVSEDELPNILKNLAYDGFNVTMPYKKVVFDMCDQLSPECYTLGNVNTVKREIDGSLTGYNTDYFGFQYIIEHNQIDVVAKKAVVLGSGGAAHTCLAVLRDLGAANVDMISRTGEYNNYSNLERFKDAEIIVNATPVGMYPNNLEKPISIEGFDRLEAVIDIIYNPYKTALILEAEKAGIKTATGLEMLVAQAGKAAEIFCKGNLEDGDIEDVIDKVLAKILNRCIIGMPGSGKSFMARRIANVQGLKLVDTDRMFINRYGMGPKEYIEEFGRDRFKVMENQILKDVTKMHGQVIATGEGVVDNPENLNLLRQNGVVIHINRNFDKLSNLNRPDDGERMTDLYARRKPLYEEWSDFDISNNADFRKSFLIVNGPNLNLLGTREPDIYGDDTYLDLKKFVARTADEMNISVDMFQSNDEGSIVDKVQEAADMYDGIVINPAGYGYTSVAILDALRAVGLPCCEVHLTNIEEREEFRRKTLTSKIAVKVISGFGFEGYKLALELLNGNLENKANLGEETAARYGAN